MKSALTEACTLKLNNFEGPFDLLFFLIEKSQIDLYDIPIVEITDQYLDFLGKMQEMDLDIASEFLVMAATLLHIKSRMLLPVHQEQEPDAGIDPREELILKLVEYKRVKEFAAKLDERSTLWRGASYKLPEVIPERKQEMTFELSPANLRESYEAVLKRVKDRTNNVRKKMDRILDNEKVSLKSKILEIMGRLADGARLCFTKLFNLKEKSRLEVATGFLAMLEVVKLGKATVEQHKMFGDIYLNLHEPGKIDGQEELIDVPDWDKDEKDGGN